MSRDWVAWHQAYYDPSSSLSQRLRDVSALIRNSLDAMPSGPIRVLSLCAGEARDLADATVEYSRRGDISGAVIELDAALADQARRNLVGAQLSLDVRAADAGDTSAFADTLPVDLLLLVGIFGNISDDDIRTTIEAVPSMCRPGAHVIWTRHRRDPDLTPTIRDWFNEAGCPDLDFVAGPGHVASGRQQVDHASSASVPTKLFTFRDDLW
jgi:hypothetical protein